MPIEDTGQVRVQGMAEEPCFFRARKWVRFRPVDVHKSRSNNIEHVRHVLLLLNSIFFRVGYDFYLKTIPSPWLSGRHWSFSNVDRDPNLLLFPIF
jgi:hypothetical protein